MGCLVASPVTAPENPVMAQAAPIPKDGQVSAQMRRMPRSSTSPELNLRRELHASGLRFRVNLKGLPGTPDVAFTRAKLAVFVDGCFWHSCPEHGVLPEEQPGLVAEQVRRERETGPAEGC